MSDTELEESKEGSPQEYDNRFVEDPSHNALYTLREYKENIDELRDRFAEPGYFKLSTVEHLTNTTGEVNTGLGQCREYVTQIGHAGDGLSGTIKAIWAAIPTIRMAIGGEDDLAKVKDWEGTLHKIHIPVDERDSVEERARIKQLVADLLRQSVEILKISDQLGDEANKVSKKLKKINLEIAETEKKLEEERKRAEKIEREKREKEESEKRKEEEDRKKKEEEERKRIEEEERLQREEEERKRKKEEDRKRKEEEERKRKEEARRKRDEEKKRKEEEERRKKELEEKRRNPSNWPVYRYEVDRVKDFFQHGLGCVLRTVDVKFEKDSLECNVLRLGSIETVIQPQEKGVSNVIHLNTCEDNVITFDELPARISIPYVDDKRRHAVPQVYVKDGATWRVTQTTCTTEAENETDPELAMAHFYIESIKDITFFVAMVTVVSTKEFRKDGGKLQAMNDAKVNVNVTKNTFKKPGTIDVKTIPKDSVNQARQRVKDDDGVLLDASSMVYLTIHGEPIKPIHLEIHFPQGDSGGTTRVRPTTANHVVTVMTSPDGYHWLRDVPSERRPNDVFVVDVNEATTKRVLLLKTKEDIHQTAYQSLARDIDEKLKQTAANLVVRQKDSDPTQVFVQCCAREKTDALLEKLKGHGYVKGPMPSKDVYIREGALLTLTFRSNIGFSDHAPNPLTLTFTASMETAKYEGFIKVVDQYKQRDREDYTGIIQLWQADQNNNSTDTNNKRMLDELPITLPKIARKKDRTRTSIYYGTAPLTKEYMSELSHELGSEWWDLGLALGLQKSSLQQILQRNANDPGEDHENVKFDMLRSWHMQTTKGQVQVDQIMNCLKQIGRQDLALDLQHKNDEVSMEKREFARRQKFKDAVKEISQDHMALQAWRSILSDLGTDQDQITSIAGQYGTEGNRKCLLEGVMDWVERRGVKADIKELANVLVRLGHKGAAENITYLLKK